MGLAIVGASCVTKPVTLGQTQIGQGKLYQSGSVNYDRFFQDTHAAQLEVMRADEDEAGARAPLEKALEANGSTLEKLYELAVARARKAGEDSPPLFYVTVTGLDTNKESKEAKENGDAPKEAAKEGPKKVTVAVGSTDPGPPPADQKLFVKALTETARAEAEILEKFGPIVTKAEQLAAYADELSDGVDKEFSGRKLRKDVNQELGAAKLILGATGERAREVSTRARSFLKGLSEALKPPLEAPPPPPPPPEKPVVKPGRSRKGGGGGKPAKPVAGAAAPAGADAPPPKPAAKPKPAEDFNP